MPLPTPAPAPAPAPIPALLAPAAIYLGNAKKGAEKAELSIGRSFVMAFLAGVYIGFGALLSFTLLNSVPGLLSTNPGLAKLVAASVFPLGLSLIIICGAELYTGNTAMLPAAVYEGYIDWGRVLNRWLVVYTGNLVGCLFMVWAINATGIMAGNTVLQNLAVAKTSLPLDKVLIRSILCNWLVCLAVWMASAASTLPGKLMGLWLPITAFVTVGLEHSVANMFVIPMGIALGAPVSAGAFLVNNLIPVTIGNTIAGAICTAGLYALCYGKASQSL
ncbi:hypothetical protein HYH03_008922 [Edaphochlamys debaryana]|uniref:Uncharacterized protein n=1 Tax=Edaphochlamys debaryana TaxID=47281 RepID=A0A835Y023_9CHLO|nr:hypothetical protein HYH03_008922 [Edaphochlamys debaryana]|eukprot:KAG2492757.1 hypothetical protein HYH03_008922 [Edaphochlamys debaryana]